jgi:hypothetical protein
MGASGWKTEGKVFIPYEGKIGMPKSNRDGLKKACMLQTPGSVSRFDSIPRSSIARTFTGLIVGRKYIMSFQQTKSLFNTGSLPPMFYNVKIDANIVFSVAPSTNYWVQVTLPPYKAESTSVSISFSISSNDKLDRDMGINGVTFELLNDVGSGDEADYDRSKPKPVQNPTQKPVGPFWGGHRDTDPEE